MPSVLEQPIPIINIPLWQALLIGATFFIFYLLLTRKKKAKEFKPLDLKKETKRRFKREYKYFGKPLNKNVYDVNAEDDAKPIAYAIGYMKVVEMNERKRLEPVYTNFSKELLAVKQEKAAQEIYDKPFSELDDVQKKNINEVSKEELRNEKIEDMPVEDKVKYVRGKREIKYSIPVPMFMLKICSPGALSKLVARMFGYGMDWALFRQDQLIFEATKILLAADFQRRTPNDIFVFNREGKNLTQDISYEVERENIWQETANQIPRAVHFDTEASKQLIVRREEAKIEREKHKAQTESHDFG